MNDFEAPLESVNEKSDPANVPHPTLLDAFRFWLKLGIISFGAVQHYCGRGGGGPESRRLVRNARPLFRQSGI